MSRKFAVDGDEIITGHLASLGYLMWYMSQMITSQYPHLALLFWVQIKFAFLVLAGT